MSSALPSPTAPYSAGVMSFGPPSADKGKAKRRASSGKRRGRDMGPSQLPRQARPQSCCLVSRPGNPVAPVGNSCGRHGPVGRSARARASRIAVTLRVTSERRRPSLRAPSGTPAALAPSAWLITRSVMATLLACARPDGPPGRGYNGHCAGGPQPPFPATRTSRLRSLLRPSRRAPGPSPLPRSGCPEWVMLHLRVDELLVDLLHFHFVFLLFFFVDVFRRFIAHGLWDSWMDRRPRVSSGPYYSWGRLEKSRLWSSHELAPCASIHPIRKGRACASFLCWPG